MRIGVAGCGIAGTTVGHLLAQQGHEVAIFEQAPECGPVGAGILLQPSGQQILESLGLLSQVQERGARIVQLHALQRSGRELVRVRYDRVSDRLFGLGLHRGVLFSLLLDACRSSGVEIVNHCRLVRFEQREDRVELFDSEDRSREAFDLVVVADGSNSRLRSNSGVRCKVREYDYAALWTTGPCDTVSDTLLQVVEGTTRLIGLLPIGEGQCSFFWGLHHREFDDLERRGLESWKEECLAFSPQCQQILTSITSLDQLTYASYRNVRLAAAVQGRVVFIGDAAHATSPHLGQGANLALADAACLARHLEDASSLEVALQGYARERRAVHRYYTRLTGWLMPFFQSGSRIRGWGRDCCLPWMPHLPFVGRQMTLTMAGLKTGWLTETR